MDSFPVDVTHFAEFHKKTAGHVRSANKSPNMSYSAMQREVEKLFGIRILDRITTKS